MFPNVRFGLHSTLALPLPSEATATADEVVACRRAWCEGRWWPVEER